MSVAAILSSMMTTERRFGAQSMTAPLLDVLVKRPGPAFGAAFDDPAHGFLHPVDLDARPARARCLPRDPGGARPAGPRARHRARRRPDLVYTFDPLLVTDRGAIPLRPGKPNRAPEPAAIEAWTTAAGIPTLGRIEAPGTVEGGDTFWLRPDLFCIGRTLRTNDDGARQLAALVGGDVRIFDVPVLARPGRADPPPVGHLAGRRRPRGRLPAAPAGRAVAAARRARHPAGRGPGRGVPDARLQRARGPARGRDHGRGEPADRGAPSPRPAARSTPIRRPRSGSTARAGRPA